MSHHFLFALELRLDTYALISLIWAAVSTKFGMFSRLDLMNFSSVGAGHRQASSVKLGVGFHWIWKNLEVVI